MEPNSSKYFEKNSTLEGIYPVGTNEVFQAAIR